MDSSFDPNGVGVRNGNFFGFPYTPQQARLVLMPVPWEVTVSFGAGTGNGPNAMIEASLQLDFFDEQIPHAWELGIATLPEDELVKHLDDEAAPKALELIENLEAGIEFGEGLSAILDEVNQACSEFNHLIYKRSKAWLEHDKRIGLVGGDHSSPLGLIRALGEVHKDFGILQIDAHADLRPAYEGFAYSHASIMYNVLREVSSVTQIVQVGVRDLCQQEYDLAQSSDRVTLFLDRQMKNAQLEGETWASQVKRIISALPQKVYISFDIDGLDPSLCPNTGTPVPGGLSYDQATYLINAVKESGREIIGFDLCEVSPGKNSGWNQNVGARLVYFLANRTLIS